MRTRSACSILFAILASLPYPSIAAETSITAEGAATVFFQERILPILKTRCYECHSHESNEANGGLVLDSRSGWQIGGDSGPAIVPKKPAESLILEAINYSNADLQMPPDAKLPADEIALLRKWVQIGAPDPRQADPAIEKRSIDMDAGRKHWAFQSVLDPTAPGVRNTEWPLDEIDAFVLASLEEKELHPAPDTDRYTWLRRVTLDLTGLQPTPEEVRSFTEDKSDGSHGRAVDRLIGSRAFGERWARHWLDLTGYADQIGTANKVAARYGWRYRDYLINAFNDDKPFDQFAREQIAGDLLTGNVKERSEAITATGFLLLSNVEVAESDKEFMRLDLVDQQVNKVSTAFLGMTVACARCHDHKFDPIPQTDYYAMAGIFRSTDSTYKDTRGVWSAIRSAELPETGSQTAARILHIEKHKEQLAAWREQQKECSEKATSLDAGSAERKQLEARASELGHKIQHAEYFAPVVHRAYAVGDVEKPTDMQITIRGNPHALGDVVPRGFLQVASWDAGTPIPEGKSGRLELANWIANENNPLTARVTVNRIWQKLFGEGLVRSVDYFGLRGETPSHPALLDHLAIRFMRGGWSQKRLIRDIVLSRAYRMGGTYQSRAASIDPDNRLLWRMNPQRRDAESLRDSLLAVAGELQPSSGGPALALEYPENVSGLNPKDVNPPAFRLTKYHPGQKSQRTIYLPIMRSEAQPGPAKLRNLFDFTQPAQIQGKRPITAVPTQALFLMNGDDIKRHATSLAKRTKSLSSQATDRIDELWLLAFSRPANDEETAEALRFLGSSSTDEPAWTELCHALLASNEFLMRL